MLLNSTFAFVFQIILVLISEFFTFLPVLRSMPLISIKIENLRVLEERLESYLST